MRKKPENQKQIVIFVATNYEEDALTAISAQLRAHHLSVTLAGLTSTAVQGNLGHPLLPDHTLSSLLKEMRFQSQAIPDGTLLAGGVQCVNHLLADPRLHDYLELLLDWGKVIGICQPLPYELVVSSSVSHRLLLQNGESYATFMDQFVRRLG